MTTPDWAWLSSWMQHPLVWTSVVGVVVVRVLSIVARSRAERQRRDTLVAVIKDSPGGTVLAQAKGLGGPAVMIIVGTGRQQLPTGRNR